jgi:alkylated DNA repair dioxygenase AlkB
MSPRQPDLFFGSPRLPDGFHYARDLIDQAQEQDLVAEFARLPFRAFEFHGFHGRRRVVSFGWRYDFNEGGLKRADPMPGFLMPLRPKAVGFAGRREETAFEQAIVTEYTPGAAIGWHRDRSVFSEVIGVSLLTSCTFRFRRKNETKWERASLIAEPRSVYLLSGSSRGDWEHSIPAVAELRYSVTFRSLR